MNEESILPAVMHDAYITGTGGPTGNDVLVTQGQSIEETAFQFTLYTTHNEVQHTATAIEVPTLKSEGLFCTLLAHTELVLESIVTLSSRGGCTVRLYVFPGTHFCQCSDNQHHSYVFIWPKSEICEFMSVTIQQK